MGKNLLELRDSYSLYLEVAERDCRALLKQERAISNEKR